MQDCKKANDTKMSAAERRFLSKVLERGTDVCRSEEGSGRVEITGRLEGMYPCQEMDKPAPKQQLRQLLQRGWLAGLLAPQEATGPARSSDAGHGTGHAPSTKKAPPIALNQGPRDRQGSAKPTHSIRLAVPPLHTTCSRDTTS